VERKRKLQVFVSSTYADLRAERQAAVEAILTAGHIPAGMELFAAGDQSQMDVIRRWIDESDVFMLLLGGRYGSIDPQTGKSYVQLEYEYAVEREKPLFGIVINDEHLEQKVRAEGTRVLETEEPRALQQFRLVVQSRMVRFWSDPRDIKLAVFETLSEYDRRPNVTGWVRADSINVAALADELARVSKENSDLRDQLNRISASEARFNGLTFDEMYGSLASIRPPDSAVNYSRNLDAIAQAFGDTQQGMLHGLWLLSAALAGKQVLPGDALGLARRLAEYGLVERDTSNPSTRVFAFTGAGQQFMLRLRLSKDTTIVENMRL
jgi:hypothetical protein